MLTEAQTNSAWQKMAEAEVRAVYFGELANQYSRRKQWISASSLFLSSGAAITVLGEAAPLWVAGVMSLVIAALMAYSIGFALDEKVPAMAKLHSSWDHLADEYERLWQRWYEPDAEKKLKALQHRARELSEAGVRAPYKSDRVDYWGKFVYSRYVNSTALPEKATTS